MSTETVAVTSCTRLVYSQLEGFIKHRIECFLLDAGFLHGDIMKYVLWAKLYQNIWITETCK